MSYYKNLQPGQWQIGNTVMGHGTNIKVESADIKPYDVDAQDYQVARSDEMRFGFDHFKPTTIELTLQVLHNRLLPSWEGTIPNFWHNMPTINDLAREWRGDDVRNTWGQMKPLYVCSKLDEIPKVIYGRTGQFGYTFDDGYNNGEVVKAIAEFRRADTLAYGVEENSLELNIGAAPVYLTRTGGDGPDAWLRVLLYGPITNPIVTIGEQQLEMAISVPTGVVVEVSSYPWQRRAVDSDRVNVAAGIVGKTQYLDQLKIPYKVPIPVKWTSDEYNTWVPALGNQSWQEDIDDHGLFQIPSTFTTLEGQAAVRFDLFNFGSAAFPWITPRTYLGAAIFANRTAILYNAMQYNTANQYAKVRVVEPKIGKSGIVIMSNNTMTNFACLIVESGFGGNFLRIATGTSPSNLTVRASWQNPYFWAETDDISFEFNNTTKTYTGSINGVSKVTWADSGGIVSTANRRQGFLFDIDGNLLTSGIGFGNIVAYDKTQVQATTGRVVLLWRDTYSVV